MGTFRDLPKEKKTRGVAFALVAVAIAMNAGIMLARYFNQTNAQRIEAAVNELATAQAAAFDKELQQLQATLQSQARTPGVIEALQQADPAVQQSQADALRAANPHTVQARLVTAGSDHVAQGLRFSQIDRINRIEHGEPSYPEAFADNDKQLLDLVVASQDASGKVIGYVLVTMDPARLADTLASLASDKSQVKLQQQFPRSKPQTILQAGVAAEGILASTTAATAVPHWNLLVVPGPQLLAEAALPSAILYAAEAAIIAALLASLVLIQRRLLAGSAVASDSHDTPIQIKGARKIDKGEFAQQTAGEIADEALADPLFQAGDVFDLDDDELLEIRPAKPKTRTSGAKGGGERFEVPTTLFRDYDIRGNAEQLTDELARRIGQAFGTECLDQGQDTVVLAGDGRLSTPRLKQAVKEGLLATGCHVVDIGNVPTPLMYFATCTFDRARSGIMVTASHNPAGDNGFKMVINGHTLASEQIQLLRERVENGDFAEGTGDSRDEAIINAYIDHISSDIVLAGSYKVVVDCGNGIAGAVAPQLLEELGCDVVPLYCDVDGHFPHHAPDPSVLENLGMLIEKVKEENADLGVAFDGDGDRLGVVTPCGSIILPDRLLMLFAKDIVSRNPGADIIFDVKSTRRLNALITGHGGRPVMWKSGHSHIKNKMHETGALLGGELSGHIFFKERWFGFDDGMYSAARLLEIMSIRDQDLDSIFAGMPNAASTPEIRISVPEARKFAIISQLAEKGEWGNGKVTTIDGVRVDFAKGWGLVRASNTAAELTLRFEADDEEALVTMQHVFKQQLQAIDKDLHLPF